MTTYNVQIKTDATYEQHSKTTSKAKANRTAQDLAACGHDGRIVTDKGHVSQVWTITQR